MTEYLPRSKSTLDLQLAHDLRSRIDAILLAPDGVDFGAAEHRAEVLKRVRRSAREISNVVDQNSGVDRGASYPQVAVTPRVQNRTRVLVVEDEYLLAESMAEHLTQAGCKVVGTARSIDAALSMIAEKDIDRAVSEAKLDGELSTPAVDAFVLGASSQWRLVNTAPTLPAAFKALPLLQKPANAAQLPMLLLFRPQSDDSIRPVQPSAIAATERVDSLLAHCFGG